MDNVLSVYKDIDQGFKGPILSKDFIFQCRVLGNQLVEDSVYAML